MIFCTGKAILRAPATRTMKWGQTDFTLCSTRMTWTKLPNIYEHMGLSRTWSGKTDSRWFKKMEWIVLEDPHGAIERVYHKLGLWTMVKDFDYHFDPVLVPTSD